jgi:transposase-like protein
MKRRTTDEWRTLFAAHASSGMTAAAFCHEHGLNTQYFGKRRKQLLKDNSLKACSSFVPVSVTGRSTAAMVELQLGETLLLKIPVSISTAWLAELIQQLQV